MLLILLTQFLWAQTYMTSIATGTTLQMDYFCQCYRATNSTGKAIMVPHKTLAEFASFYSGPPPNVTVNNFCIGSSVLDFDIGNISSSICNAQSIPVLISGDSGSIRVRKTGLASCIVAVTTTPPKTYKVNNVGTSNTTFSVCNNDYIQLEISCGVAGLNSGSVIFETPAGINIDTVSVSINNPEPCF